MQTLQILFVLLEILNYAQSASFDNVPLQIDQGNWLIEATLYDQSDDKKYFIKEMIHSGQSILGKISITSDIGSIDVFYDNKFKDDRLIIHNNFCEHFTYKSISKLPGIKNSLLNRILVVGPSLNYRLNEGNHKWKSGSDEQIRGARMHKDFAYLNGNKLQITRYFKNKDASQPDRLVFYGTDVNNFASKKQTFIMDFTASTKLEDDVSGLVTITPGIGCPFYLASLSSSVPNTNSNQLRYLLVENVKGPKPSSRREEVYADSKKQLLYRKMSSEGKEEEIIYDFSLGISYELLDDGNLAINPMSPTDPGVEVTYMQSSISLNLLLSEVPRDEFKFLGIRSIDQQNVCGKYYVYEAVEYNKATKNGTHDKVVTTQYFIFSYTDLGYEFYAFHSVVINAYKFESNSYNLIETTQRNYYDYGYAISGEMYESIFNIGNYFDSQSKETFALNFKCRSSKESCDYFGQKMPYSYSDTLKDSLVNTGTIAASRIAKIDVVFNQNETIAYVTFNKLLPLKDAFRNESMYVAKKVLKKSLVVAAGSADECLHLYTKRATTFEALVYCESKICTIIDKIDDLVEDKLDGVNCEVFYVPLKNLNRYDRELSFDAIKSELISRGLSFSLYNGASLAQYTIATVTKVSNEIEKLFSPLYTAYNLPEHNDKVQVIREAKNLGDCYHACGNSDGCQTFSVCLYPGEFKCLVSTFDSLNLSTDLLSPDELCTVFRTDLVHNYNPVINRRFSNAALTADNIHLDNCALLCHQSSQCYSFQFCNGQCSFAGVYSDSSTEYDPNCSIYTPKVSDKFKYTGHKIASATHHTELNLTMDQCTALCDAWNANDEPCLSINYCPKGETESLCSLSKFSVKNPSTQSVVSDKCINYEYKASKKFDFNTKPDQVESTSEVAAFGIITLFLVVGLVAGIATPIVYKKMKPIKIDYS